MKKQNLMTLTSMFLLLGGVFGSCTNNSVKEEETVTGIQVPERITGEDSITYIENMKYQSPISAKTLLSLAKVHSIEENLLYYNNQWIAEEHPDLFIVTHRDSCALKLPNRFMRMHHLAYENGDAMDMLQWAIAVNAVLDTFRVEIPEVHRDSTIDEIIRVISKFSSATNYELRMMSDADASIEYYHTIEAYRQWLDEVPESLKPLACEEYEAWFQLNEARYTFWRDVSNTQEWYSLKPMEYDSYYSCLAENRRAELTLERDIILDGKAYQQLGKTVTTKHWEDWLSEKSVPEDWELPSGLIPDSTIVKEKKEALESAVSRWLAARQAIAAALPDKQSKSYDYLTADIHCRIVGRLEWLVPFEELIY